MKPVIFGCAGPNLNDEERFFFEQQQPAGFILFARNIQSPQQLKVLTTDLRLAVGRSDVLILIDQEGGRVQRMTEPYWRKYPPLLTFGIAFEANSELAQKALGLNCQMLADDLRRVGINTNCLPLLYVPITAADPIIGDRALGASAGQVATLGQHVVDSLLGAGVLPVAKHIPGHGRATVDSHLDLPVVTDSKEMLIEQDFSPFKAINNCPLGMTAHVVYEAYDAENTATLSETVIKDVIRGHIGFDGLLMTDDISMKALNGEIGDLAAHSLVAGCDIVLHCNGDMTEMQAIAGSIDVAPNSFEDTIAVSIAKTNAVSHVDRKALEVEYDQAMTELYTLVEG